MCIAWAKDCMSHRIGCLLYYDWFSRLAIFSTTFIQLQARAGFNYALHMFSIDDISACQ